jgi:hypothetical protein
MRQSRADLTIYGATPREGHAASPAGHPHAHSIKNANADPLFG